MSDLLSYEQAVEVIRSDPGMHGLIRDAYLDRDPQEAWARFSESEEWSAVLELLNLSGESNSRRILDIGCGNGIASMAFCEAGHSVVAVDPDINPSVGSGAILAKSNCEISVVKSFAESLPFANASFDFVYGRQVLHHFSSLAIGVKECARVVRPKGQLLFCREHVVDDPNSLSEFLQHHPLHKYHGGEYAYTVTEYLAAFSAAGLKVRALLGPFDSVINHFPTLNCEVHGWFEAGLRRRLGRTIGTYLAKSTWLERLYRRALSKKFKQPGRLYSFLLESQA